MTADKPDPRIPPVGTYEYEVLGRTPGGLNETGPTPGDESAARVAAQRLSWLDEATIVAMQSAGYLKPPTRWQRFKAWVSRLFGRWS